MRGVWVKSTLAGLVGIQRPRTRPPPMHTYGLNSVLRSIWWGAERSCSQSSGNLAFTWKPRVSEETSSLCRQYFVKDEPETADSDYEPSGFMESTASAWQISVMQGQLKRSNTSPCSQSKHECLATRKKVWSQWIPTKMSLDVFKCVNFHSEFASPGVIFFP